MEIVTSRGEAAAQIVRQAIESRLLAISVWSTILERLDQVDWTNRDVLHMAVSHPEHCHQHTDDPLCAILTELDEHEG